MTAPPREPVAWIDPDYLSRKPYGKVYSPVCAFPVTGWTPLYAAPPVAQPAEPTRDRPTTEPGGCECERCGCIFIGSEAHTLCGVCVKLQPAEPPATDADRLRDIAMNGSYGACSDACFRAADALTALRAENERQAREIANLRHTIDIMYEGIEESERREP